jgi:RHS repeat-associated protein
LTPRPSEEGYPCHTTDVTYGSATGQLSSRRRSGRQVSFLWDGPLLTSESSTGLSSVGWTYDADFRVASMAIDGVSTARTWDADGLLTSVGPVLLARAPSSGRLVSTTVGPVSTAYAYSQYGELQSVTTSVSGTVLYSQGLQYDAVGNPLVSEESLSGSTRQESYSYDAVGRLTSVTRNGASTAFAYGPNSTRILAGAAVATFDAQDRLLSQGATTYTWDVHGNRATDSTGVTYTHDGLGRLANWAKGTTSVSYEVDALDRRVLRRRNGVVSARYVYEGQYRIVAELESGSRFLYATHGHSPDAMVRAGVTYVFVKNHLGSVRAVVNGSTGQVVQALDYDTWGNVLADSSPGFQPFAFAGGLYDADSKLTHFGWRDYDASTGTWTSKDPIRQAGGLNVYVYGSSSPTRHIDPDGLKPGKRFSGRWAQNKAAVDALDFINPPSISTHTEHSGLICRDTTTNEYFATMPVNNGQKATCPNPYVATSCPSGSVPTAWYHTHGGNDPGYDNEVFSTSDRNVSAWANKNFGGGDGYLGTPARSYQRYDAITKGPPKVIAP